MTDPAAAGQQNSDSDMARVALAYASSLRRAISGSAWVQAGQLGSSATMASWTSVEIKELTNECSRDDDVNFLALLEEERHFCVNEFLQISKSP
jgi:hypothetical protein